MAVLVMSVHFRWWARGLHSSSCVLPERLHACTPTQHLQHHPQRHASARCHSYKISLNVRDCYRWWARALYSNSCIYPEGLRACAPTRHLQHHQQLHTSACCHAYKISENVRDCYQLLNVSEESSMVEVKEAYFKLAKMYHPDSKSKQADAQKFSQVQQAYNAVCAHIEKLEKRGQRDGLEDDLEEEHGSASEFDIKHTAPQHRQYLEYEGYGYGTPSQRQKQYQKLRAAKAADAVSTHRVYKIAVTDEKGLVLKDKRAARKIRTTNVIERLVEDLIQDSMAKGDFDDLPGKGKPLPPKTDYCPHIDASTHHLNQVLVNNGYAPEWIQLEKEIRNLIQNAKDLLLRERLKLGPEPLNDYNVKKWAGLQIEFTETVRGINKKRDDFNLIVPIIRLQMVHIRPEREIAKVVDEYLKLEDTAQSQRTTCTNEQNDERVGEDIVGAFASRVLDSFSNYVMRLVNLMNERNERRNQRQL